jgi:hypothetical protein
MKIVEARQNDNGDVEIKVSLSQKDHIKMRIAGYERDNMKEDIVNKIDNAQRLFQVRVQPSEKSGVDKTE